jgi:phosphatidylglycerophosphatase A
MRIPRLIAAGLGTGFSPVAPGTVASAAALAIGAGLMLASPLGLPLAALASIAGGYWAITRANIDGDPGWVVIDEFAGQWIAMLALPAVSWPGLLAAFALFRLFDIVKPGPVGWADRQHGAFGIMADDVVAGVLAALLLAAANLLAPSLLI